MKGMESRLRRNGVLLDVGLVAGESRTVSTEIGRVVCRLSEIGYAGTLPACKINEDALRKAVIRASKKPAC